MQKKQIIEFSVTGALIVVLFFVVIRAVKKVKHPSTKQQAGLSVRLAVKPNTGQAMDKGQILAENLYGKLEEETQKLTLKIDPFSSLPIVFEGGIHLSGIVWSDESPLAIIGENIVKIGDEIEGNIVVEIKQNSVILNDGTKDFEVRLE